MTEKPTGTEQAVTHTEKVGAFDIRNFIGALIGLYGVILLIVGLVGFSEEEAARTGGVNANLWAGVAMIAFGLVFLAWAKLKPLVVKVEEDPSGEAPRDIAAADE
ncbi:hypothetical protein ACQBAU_14030 [Propionibacteriaceae bacterium Y2011]|uniref:hypothetical protein n=1 Tax=Microlunatus sp. Y2014 TaxID=3418488 RepID=UPI003B460F38